MTTRLKQVAVVLALALVTGGCTAQQAFKQGETATRAGNLDEAVTAYRKAVQEAPENANYRISLERATQAASRSHLEKARGFEEKDQLEAALGEYKAASEYDPTNRLATAKITALDRTIRDRIEATRPQPAITQMRERARAASAPPALINPNEVLTGLRFTNASLKDVLAFIGTQTGINVTYDREVQDRPVTVQLDGVTLEQALNQIMAMNQLSYKVVSDRSIFVFPDTPPKHAQYDEQVVRTFYLANADPTEISQLLSVIIRLPGIAVQPAIAVNKTTNTLTVRATAAVVQILEKIIEQNDKPRAEIVVDVEILEVDRNRVKNYGINLSSYNPILGAVFSPEVSPTVTVTGGTGGTGGAGGTGGTGGGGTNTTAPGGSTAPGAQVSPPLFNLNTITRGFSSTDFYLAVPTALVRFLESDSKTKVVAKPQLRGAEGTKLSFAVGDQIPIVSTSYTPIATGGAGVNPLSSYQYKDVGVKVEMTPRVTVEGDVILDITLEDNQLGADKAVAGVTVPSFVQRTVTTRLRLRDGESNLLAGLIQEREQTSVSGFPGAIHVPFFKQVFSQNANTTDQVEIVMLLTPHIVRTQELTENDLKPIYIGSQQNLGVGGPPPLIAAPPPLEPPPPAPPAAVPGAGQPGTPTVMRGPGGTPVTVAAPPGSTPVPGTVLVPPPAPAPAAAPTTEPGTPTPAAPVTPAPGAATTPPGTAPPATPPQAPSTPPESTTSAGIGQAQIIVSPSGTTFRVGGGPYVVPISISGASRLSTITLTIIFDPTKLRVRTVQEGSFMRAGGVNVTFGQQANGNNRIDITLARAADSTGASGTGLLAAILFDAIAPGAAAITTSGTATGPGGTPMGLRFTPVTVTVQP